MSTQRHKEKSAPVCGRDPRPFGSSLYIYICFFFFFPPPGPVLCKLGQPGALFVLPEVLTLVLGPSFVLFLQASPFLVFQPPPFWTPVSYSNYLTQGSIAPVIARILVIPLQQKSCIVCYKTIYNLWLRVTFDKLEDLTIIQSSYLLLFKKICYMTYLDIYLKSPMELLLFSH